VTALALLGRDDFPVVNGGSGGAVRVPGEDCSAVAASGDLDGCFRVKMPVLDLLAGCLQVSGSDLDLFEGCHGAPPLSLALTLEDDLSACNRHSSYSDNPLGGEFS
jgi:hypothetical protein